MYVKWYVTLLVFLLTFHFFLAVKAGGMRVSKKQENGPVEKNAKPPGKEKSRYYTAGPVHPCSIVKVHRQWALKTKKILILQEFNS